MNMMNINTETNLLNLKHKINKVVFIFCLIDMIYSVCIGIYGIQYTERIEFKTVKSLDELTEYNIKIIFNKLITNSFTKLYCISFILSFFINSIMFSLLIKFYKLKENNDLTEGNYVEKAYKLKLVNISIILLISLYYLFKIDINNNNCPEGFIKVKEYFCCKDILCNMKDSIDGTGNNFPFFLFLLTIEIYFLLSILILI